MNLRITNVRSSRRVSTKISVESPWFRACTARLVEASISKHCCMGSCASISQVIKDIRNEPFQIAGGRKIRPLGRETCKQLKQLTDVFKPFDRQVYHQPALDGFGQHPGDFDGALVGDQPLLNPLA